MKISITSSTVAVAILGCALFACESSAAPVPKNVQKRGYNDGSSSYDYRPNSDGSYPPLSPDYLKDDKTDLSNPRNPPTTVITGPEPVPKGFGFEKDSPNYHREDNPDYMGGSKPEDYLGGGGQTNYWNGDKSGNSNGGQTSYWNGDKSGNSNGGQTSYWNGDKSGYSNGGQTNYWNGDKSGNSNGDQTNYWNGGKSDYWNGGEPGKGKGINSDEPNDLLTGVESPKYSWPGGVKPDYMKGDGSDYLGGGSPDATTNEKNPDCDEEEKEKKKHKHNKHKHDDDQNSDSCAVIDEYGHCWPKWDDQKFNDYMTYIGAGDLPPLKDEPKEDDRNGYQPGGYGSKGYQPDAYGSNGYQPEGDGSDGHLPRWYSPNGNQPEGYKGDSTSTWSGAGNDWNNQPIPDDKKEGYAANDKKTDYSGGKTTPIY